MALLFVCTLTFWSTDLTFSPSNFLQILKVPPFPDWGQTFVEIQKLRFCWVPKYIFGMITKCCEQLQSIFRSTLKRTWKIFMFLQKHSSSCQVFSTKIKIVPILFYISSCMLSKAVGFTCYSLQSHPKSQSDIKIWCTHAVLPGGAC